MNGKLNSNRYDIRKPEEYLSFVDDIKIMAILYTLIEWQKVKKAEVDSINSQNFSKVLYQ